MPTTCTAGSTNCNFTCPNGGSWFVCPSAPYFVGCCASDPCSDSTCPSLYPASFNSSIFDEIVANRCIDQPSTNWYTCNTTSPTFIGCCKSNPCGDGCPDDDLISAAWSSTAVGQFHLFLDGASTPTATPTPSNDSSGLGAGAIAGITVGSVAGLATIIALFFLLRRRRHRNATGKPGEQRILMGQYGEYGPASPYQDSNMTSPDPTVKHASVPSTAFTASPSLLQSSDGHRPVSEIYSQSDETRRNHGLRISGTPTVPQSIPELDTGQSEIHELDGSAR
ncbi:hypothetical protein BO71DRAFT_402889 [Aspergillus ellipticus CBS 707.79]|uniref:Uncharacterized protein n=1 Tax=Aspergillus ellipticus CBS 707.79 TaxID=1448320 RepID=A0A319CY40_9EURO|nr:hypothetical protein BO71DRAFT_402889 [Aspergillus ellipticus CBS 707.79]